MKDKIKISDLPHSPGVYIFRNIFGKVIYVGKAVDLRKRVSQYFRKSGIRFSDPKFRSLVKSINSVEHVRTKNENEALLLESKLIKEYAPQYNVVMRDDKRFFLIKIDRREKLPRMKLVRLKKDDGALYFGPFPHGGALKETVEFLSAKCGIKVCKNPEPDQRDFKHCIAGATERCSAPCVGKISLEDYLKRVENLISILSGNIKDTLKDIESQMNNAAAQMDFEKAAKLRDISENIKSLFKGDRRFLKTLIPAKASPQALEDLKEKLNLPVTPRRIEAFDVSNLAGTFAVASMVSFLDGKPDRKNYRRFRIKSKDSPDDFAMMNETVKRRLQRLIGENKPLPDLILVDGGKGQLSAATAAMQKLNCPKIAFAALAKKQEEIFLPQENNSILLPEHSPALKLLQTIRDEAHRFALTYHRQLREKRIVDSILDEIPGIGKKRKMMILKTFGSVQNLRKYTADEIVSKVPQIGAKFAKTITDYLSKK